jgi:flavin reductase (DIM6/NTAB) family NADH-FMN oxidoreductase RutF
MRIDPGNLDYRDSYKLGVSMIVPRPIAFVSTIGEDGVFNVAPFSAFMSLSIIPMVMCFGVVPRRDGQKKDTLINVEFSKDFVINVVNETLAEAMNQTSASYPIDVDEFKEVGLTAVKSDIVKAPRVGESPINMECKLLEILEFGKSPHTSHLVIGKVVLVHIKDELCLNGEIQMSKLEAIGRLGGDFYCRTTNMFEMKRPPSGYS